MKTKKILALLISGVFATTMASQGAVIAWGTPTDVNDVNDISTTGTLVEAINLNDGTAGTVDANGVTFTNDGSLLSGSTGADNFAGNTGDAGYNEILSTFDFGSQTLISLGGGNLEIGKDYEIQLFWAYAGWLHGYGDGNGNNVELDSPEWVIGTFTADATSQNLSLRTPNTDSWGNSHLNAYQIRDITPVPPVPEPSSTALLGLGGLALMLRRKRS